MIGCADAWHKVSGDKRLDRKSTKAADGAPYQLDGQAGFVLRRATQRHLAIFAAHIPSMTPTQFAALAKLCEAGPMSQNELGRRTAMDGATIKGVIDRLRERGHIVSRPDEDDRRRMLIEVSPQGRAAFERCVDAARQITRETLSPLDADEQARFLELLAKLT